MYAMELSGVHVGKIVKIKYRYPSYSKSRPDNERTMTITSLEHKRDGKVVIYHGSARLTVPANATVAIAEFSNGGYISETEGLVMPVKHMSYPQQAVMPTFKVLEEANRVKVGGQYIN